ncbi:hypothetical protein SSAG_01450 [Streptomyces sp. Mg1]|nr:hypothetical protein SSAG_01450 [Streptomyces sp. Mg1]
MIPFFFYLLFMWLRVYSLFFPLFKRFLGDCPVLPPVLYSTYYL